MSAWMQTENLGSSGEKFINTSPQVDDKTQITLTAKDFNRSKNGFVAFDIANKVNNNKVVIENEILNLFNPLGLKA